jgi:hypothetical protein
MFVGGFPSTTKLSRVEVDITEPRMKVGDTSRKLGAGMKLALIA